ncbi:MAG: argininosuccinate synthase [Elusimicrobia bacterium]|nr:argininosuccinate synthase [Candidatus Obscuribacterium magneticum]
MNASPHAVKKIVLAYSGGLDTSVILKWLLETYRVPVVACYVNIGQREKEAEIRRKAFRTGAAAFFAPRVQEEYVTDYLWPALRARAVYEEKYLLGTALARPLIAEKVVDVARRVGADAVAHGATGKGNDQVRFELGFAALAPHLKVIAPWRTWKFKGREDLVRYAQRNGIPVPVSKKKPYSTDANLWHISHEGGLLENLETPVPESVYEWTAPPQKAPSKPLTLDIGFVKGNPVSLNGKKTSPVEMVTRLNIIGGRHAVGRVDMVENRLVGLKSRGIYECPAATILYAAHRELESLTLDRDTAHQKALIGPKMGELIYFGQWFAPLRRALQAFVDKTQVPVTGRVRLRLYKGNIEVISRAAKKSLYSQAWVTFEKEALYDPSDATGFIHLYGLPLKMNAMLRTS